MRLFLSSENLGNYPEVFKDMLGKNKRLAFVHNAIDYWSPQDRRRKVEQHLEQLKSQGFMPIDLDLRDYFGKPKELQALLDSCDGIFLFGGNTFILRRAMAQSGLDEILKRLLAEDKIVYGGSSAGSMIMTPDLKGPDWSDEDRADIVPEGYDPKPIYEGLSLVDFYIVPHFGSEMHGDSPKELADYYISKDLAHYVLKDGQVVVVDGDKTEVLK